jgi:hypothetical protein
MTASFEQTLVQFDKIYYSFAFQNFWKSTPPQRVLNAISFEFVPFM